MRRSALTFDAIIVGGGHNGLVAAGYLARAGLRVRLFEARHKFGGLAQSAKVFGEASGAEEISVAAAWSGMLQPTVCRSLKLSLDILPLDPQHLYVGTDGGVHFHPLSPAERGRFFKSQYGPRASSTLHSLARLEDRLAVASDDLRRICHEPSLHGRSVVARTFAPGVDEFLEESMDDIFLGADIPSISQAAMVQAGMSLQNGATSLPGGGFCMSYMAMARTAGIPGAWGLPRGGMGSVAQALSRRAEQLGASLSANAPVRELRPSSAGFVVRTDELEVWSTLVLFACGFEHVSRIIGKTIDEPAACPGKSASVHLRLKAVPKIRQDLAPLISNRLWSALIGSGPSDLEGVSDAAAGFKPVMGFSTPLLLSTSLMGTHSRPVLYVYVQFVAPSVERTKLATAVVAQLQDVFPDLEQLVLDAKVLTPRDIASGLMVPGGHPEHYQMSYPALLFERPTADLAGYRLSDDGLYHGSASSFPGGLVSGLPGRNAALTMIRDWSNKSELPIGSIVRHRKAAKRADACAAFEVRDVEPARGRADTTELIEAATALEAEVFFSAFHNTASDLQREYGQYFPAQTRFLVALAPDVVGMMRLILPGRIRQKTLVDLEEPPFRVPVGDDVRVYGASESTILDIATVAIRRSWRGSGAFEALAARAVEIAHESDLLYLTAIIDERLLQYLRRRSVTFVQLAAPAPYLGSKRSVPVLINCDSDSTTSANRGMVQGVGLATLRARVK